MTIWKWMAYVTSAFVLIGAGWIQAGRAGSASAQVPDVGDQATSSRAARGRTAPTGLAAEPILYSNGRFSYVGFRQAALTDLHAALSQLVGDRVQLRVIPYVGMDPSTREQFLKGETLNIFAQEPDADLTALKQRAERLMAAVRATFPDLGDTYTVRMNARLPEGSNRCRPGP